jgi:hypothetical protein
MKFGRVENPSLVDHQIPESFKWGSFEQKSAVSENGLTVYLGAPAWGDRGYIGKIYPPKTKPFRLLIPLQPAVFVYRAQYHVLSYTKNGDH